MLLEDIWKWLVAVDQDRLELMDQWDKPPPRACTRKPVPKANTVSHAGKRTFQQYDENRNADAASLLKPPPPAAGMLLRNGNIKMFGAGSTPPADDVGNEKSIEPSGNSCFTNIVETIEEEAELSPEYPMGITTVEESSESMTPPEDDVENEDVSSQPLAPSANDAGNREASRQPVVHPADNMKVQEELQPQSSGQSKKNVSKVKSEKSEKSVQPRTPATDESESEQGGLSSGYSDSADDPPASDCPPNQLQSTGREGNGISITRKRLPTYPEQSRTRADLGVLQSIPSIHIEDTDPVAIECQGARVIGGNLPIRARTSRRYTTPNGKGALHRSNALKGPSKVRGGSHLRPS